MGQAISRLTIKGFKSIRCLENFELRKCNILIGPNGAGKSNFVSIFTFVDEMRKGSFDRYVQQHGGVERFFFLGTKFTDSADIILDKIDLILYPKTNGNVGLDLVTGMEEGRSVIKQIEGKAKEVITQLCKVMDCNFRVYHFHDTSMFAGLKRPGTKRDYEYLRPDASNLAAFLLFLRKKHEIEYQRIRETIQLAAPFFDDFLLRDSVDNPDETLLEWRQKGSDYPFLPSQMSDGTLRFVCLATALLQPEPPSIILLDEPELGLHPYALTLLAALIKKAAAKTQVIVSTQSAALIDHFEPQDIIVVDRKNDESIFRRLNKADLEVWLQDYSLGELWQKNIFGGRPGNV